MNGYMPLKYVSPMWITSLFTKCTIASPSVCARGTWIARISSPFRWKVIAAGEGDDRQRRLAARAVSVMLQELDELLACSCACARSRARR